MGPDLHIPHLPPLLTPIYRHSGFGAASLFQRKLILVKV